jgi:predicted HicB family RNase H-like nuclease
MTSTMTYKGYTAEITYSDEDEAVIGRILGITDIITFHATTVEELKKRFYQSVDDYIKACATIGKKPMTPKSGKLVFRTSPEKHALIANLAQIKNLSINSFIEKAVDHEIENSTA